MSEQGKLEVEAIATALEFKADLEVLLDKYKIHAALFCWITPSIEDHVGVGSSFDFGCPECGGRAAALAVRHLDLTWRGSFLEQLHGGSNFKVIHDQHGSSGVN